MVGEAIRKSMGSLSDSVFSDDGRRLVHPSSEVGKGTVSRESTDGSNGVLSNAGWVDSGDKLAVSKVIIACSGKPLVRIESDLWPMNRSRQLPWCISVSKLNASPMKNKTYC